MHYYKTELLIKTEKKPRKPFSVEDECVYNAYQLLMYVLEERLRRKNEKIEEQTDNPFDERIEFPDKDKLFKYFETLINEVTEKFSHEGCQRHSLANSLDNDDYVHRNVCDGNVIIFSLDDYGKRRASQKAIKREEAIAEAKKKQREKEKMLEQAKRIAKAELLAEQERAKAIEEAEAEDVDIVIPFRNYGK